jgi:peroxiredoxin
LVGFESHIGELESLGLGVVAASVDALEDARPVQDELSFPVAYGVTRDMADQLGSWWDISRQFIQPSEFLIDRAGKIILSSYSAGPLARLLADDVVDYMRRMIKYKVL